MTDLAHNKKSMAVALRIRVAILKAKCNRLVKSNPELKPLIQDIFDTASLALLHRAKFQLSYEACVRQQAELTSTAQKLWIDSELGTGACNTGPKQLQLARHVKEQNHEQ